MLLLAAAVLAFRRSRSAVGLAGATLLAALAVAIYDERVLGFGHPSHHAVRLLYSAIVLWATVRSVRGPGSAAADP